MSKAIFPYALNNDLSNVRNINEYEQFGFNEHGKSYLDLSMGNCGCFTLGFDRKDIVTKVSEKLNELPFCSGEFLTTNESVQLLAEKLYNLSGGYRSVFSLSGSDAVEGAIRIAQLYHLAKEQPRKTIVGFDNSYHGSTFLSSSAGDTKDMHMMYGRHEPCITLSRTLEDLDRDWSDTLCVVIETSSWQDGLKPISAEFWSKLRQVCTDNDVILIVDDIAMCGGKTGNMFGWKTHTGEIIIEPDIFTMGKGFTAGYFPLSATLMSEKVFEYVQHVPFVHGFTYSFSLSGIYSVLEYMDVLEKENILSNYENILASAKGIFDSLKSQDVIRSYTHHGLVFNLNLVNQNYYDNQETMESHFKKFGLSSGMWNEGGDGLLIIIPLNATEEYIAQLHIRLSNALESYNGSLDAIPN